MQQHFAKIGRIPDAIELTGVGYFANLTGPQIDTVCKDPQVRTIEENSYARLAGLHQHNGALSSPHELKLYPRTTDTDIGYGLAYSSANQKNPPEPYTYHYLDDSGEGVDIYIIDSGVNPLDDFGDRLMAPKSYSQGGSTADSRDHGTMVAAFAASGRYGTAKRAFIWPYKVHDSGESISLTVEKALEDIVKADKERRKLPGYKGAVINISLDLINTPELETNVIIAQSNKIAVVVASGNDYQNAEKANPLCRYDDMICVGAIDKTYDRADFSNWGSKVTIMAPGKDLTGYHSDGSISDDNSGTSFAAPYVAGILATFYGREGRVEGNAESGYRKAGLTVPQAIERLKQNADRGFLGTNLRGSPNLLANNGFQKSQNGYIGAPPPPAPPSPPGGQGCNNRRDGQGPGCSTSAASHTTSAVNSAGIIGGEIESILNGATTTQQTTLVTTATSSVTSEDKPTASSSPVCWQTDSVEKPMPTNIAAPAVADFGTACKNTLHKPTNDGERAGCIMMQLPAQQVGVGDDDLPWINMSVEQIWWAGGQKSAEDVGGEISYVMTSIMSECQTNAYESMTIGGWTVTGTDETGYRRWNLTGLAEKEDTPSGFTIGV